MKNLTLLINSIIERTQAQTEQRFEHWGIQNHEPEKWLTILMEELGEAAKARLKNDRKAYKDELFDVAVAAVCALTELDIDDSVGATITINGKQHVVTTATIDFEEVCRLAGQPEYSTVLYSGGAIGKPSGVLIKGKWVLLKDGMEFSAVPTGNA